MDYDSNPHAYSAITNSLASPEERMLLLGWNGIVCLELNDEEKFTVQKFFFYYAQEKHAALQRAKDEGTQFSRAFTLAVETCTTAVICKGNRIVFLHLDDDPTRNFVRDVSNYLTEVEAFLADSAGGLYLMISYCCADNFRNTILELITQFRNRFAGCPLTVSIFPRGDEKPTLSHVAFGFSISDRVPKIYFDAIPATFFVDYQLSVNAFFTDRNNFAKQLDWDQRFFIFNKKITAITTDDFKDFKNFCKKCFISALQYNGPDYVSQNLYRPWLKPRWLGFLFFWSEQNTYLINKVPFVCPEGGATWVDFMNHDPFKSYFDNLWAENVTPLLQPPPAPPAPAPQSAAVYSSAQTGKTPSLKEVCAAISTLKTEADFPLAGALDFTSLFATVFNPPKFHLTNIRSDPAKPSFSGCIAGAGFKIGQISVSLSGVPVNFTFQSKDSWLLADMSFDLGTAVDLLSGVLEQFKIKLDGKASFCVSLALKGEDAPYVVYKFTMNAGLTVFGEIDFTAELSTDPDFSVWSVSVKAADKKDVSINADKKSISIDDIFSFLGIGGISGYLPRGLSDLLDETALSSIDLTIQNGKVVSVAATVDCLSKGEIKITSNIAINDITFSVKSERGGSSTFNMFSVTAVTRVGDIKIPVTVSCYNDLYNIKLGGDKPLKLSLADIGHMADADLPLPDEIADSGISLNTLQIAVLKETKQIATAVSVSLENPLCLDKFTIKDITFNYSDLPHDGKICSLSGTCDIDGVSLAAWGKKTDKGWQYGISSAEDIEIGKFAEKEFGLPNFPGKFRFCALSQARDKGRVYALGLMTSIPLDFSALPLVGSYLKGAGFRTVRIIYASADFDNLTLGGITDAKKTPAGCRLIADFTIFDKTQKIELPLGGRNALTAGAGAAVSIKIDKHIGPLDLRAVTVSFADGVLWFALDASLEMSSISFNLVGLAIGWDFSAQKVRAEISGLGLDITTAALKIGGEFAHVRNEYQGGLLAGCSAFSINAAGAYNPQAKSLFALGFLDANIGGPPCFFIRGVALGFGVHRQFSIPSIDKLESYALLKVAAGTLNADKILADEDTYFPPDDKACWIAAGIKFTSFNMIDSVALVSDEFVSETIALLGRSVLDVPSGSKSPVAHAALLLEARVLPAAGLVSVEALLASDSYILSRDCHLTGGFAFYSWFSGEHSGDFVITLGGYRDGYNKPAHYPSVPRVGFYWDIGGGLAARGSLYFALTPAELMAGGMLSITYHSGIVKAWFDAWVDILMQWKPYHYSFSIGINMGVSVHLWIVTVKLELGCDLRIWGPDFSGNARIHLYCVSFSINFGNTKDVTPVIDVNEFKTSFLPRPRSSGVSNALVYAGPALVISGRRYAGKGDDSSAVSVITLKISTKTPVPCGQVKVYKNDTEAGAVNGNGTFHLKPCKDAPELHSTHTVRISRTDKKPIDAAFTLSGVTSNLPSALWGGGGTIPALVGIEITVNESGNYSREVMLPDCEIVRIHKESAAGAREESSLVTLADSCKPALYGGNYTVETWDNSPQLGESEHTVDHFSVQSTNFTKLPPDSVSAVYPPGGMTGSFSHTLPHIVWKEKTLPWEHEGGRPVIALLLLKGNEILPADNAVLRMPAALFKKIAPAREEMIYLSHAKKTGDSWVSVTMCNRVPLAGNEPVKYRVYAVSLEQFDTYENIKDDAVSLPLLYSYDFTVIPETRNFLKVVEELNLARISPAGSLDYYTQDGDKSSSLYRSAFAPDRDTPAPAADISSGMTKQLGRLLTLNNSAVAMEMLQRREAAKLAAHKQGLRNAAAAGGPPVYADKAPAAVMEYIAEKLKGAFL